ncbi:MAG TPA: sialidase family protein [Planctomycetota bacterium]|nr:sialidase family protein [Planctomycetota bacterium]
MRLASLGPVLALMGLTLAASPAFAGDVVTIHEGHEARRPAIARDEKGALHLAYSSYDKGSPVPGIFHAASFDGGKTWEPGVNISRTGGIASDPAIACGKGQHIVIVWLDTTPGMERPDIYGTFSSDGGKTWEAPVDVSLTPGKSMEPSVAIAPDGTVHVVWADTTDSDKGPEIWHALSTDKGATWSTATNISHSLGNAWHPRVACGPKNEVHVCWADRLSGHSMPDIFFSTSTDGGKTFSKLLDVSNTRGLSTDPDLAVDDSGTLYLVWAETPSRSSGRWDILFTLSRDGGTSWEKNREMGPTGGRSSQPAVSAREGAVAVVWRDKTGHETNPEICIALSSDGGKSFAEPKDISMTLGASRHPALEISGGRAHVVWEERDKGLSSLRFVSVPVGKSH